MTRPNCTTGVSELGRTAVVSFHHGMMYDLNGLPPPDSWVARRCTDRGVVGLFGAPSNTMQGGWWYPRPSVDVLRRNSVCVDVDAETGKHIEDDRVVAAELHRLRTRVDPIKLIMGHDRDHSDVASYYEAAAIDL